MAEQVTRRNFFKLIGGAVALAATPVHAIANIIEVPVEFGWTWHVDKAKVPSNLSDIITKTLRDNANTLRENISQNNALYLKLKEGQKVKLNIERISPEAQTERMQQRMDARFSRFKHYGKGNEPKYECLDNKEVAARCEAKKQAIIEGRIPQPLYKEYMRGKQNG